MKKNTLILFCILFLLSLLAASASYARPLRCKVALIHSFEPGYSTCERAREKLSKELLAIGIDGELQEYFLDCDFYEEPAENRRMGDFLTHISNWGAQVIAVLDDQATYALMACGHPLAKEIPVVFSGVNYPNEKLLARFPNVTGYVDSPDYLSTIRMIERVMGKGRVCLMNGSTFLDRKVWSNLIEQCEDQDFYFVHQSTDSIVFTETRIRELIDPSKEWKQERSVLDSTIIMRLTTDSIPIQDLTWLGNGSHINTVFLYTKNDYTTNRIALLFQNPSFATINEGFGVNDYMLGGYFTPLEVQLQYMAAGIKERLENKTPQQLTYCPKKYVLNWHVLQRYGISLESIPEEYTVMYIPFYVRYRTPIIYVSIILAVAILSIITILSLGFLRERKRKRVAQEGLRYEHETFRLAIEGNNTYAWRLMGDTISCDAMFYELIHHSPGGLHLDEIAHFVHPEDLEIFQSGREILTQRSKYKGQYRCNFSGEYEWWEFSYNTIYNEKGEPIIAGLLRNVQEQKNREAELIEARKMAEKAEMKQSFLNNMSHEIRTPLNSIAGFSSMLVAAPDLPEDERQEFADLIDKNTQLLLKLVDGVLELSGIESGCMPFQNKEESVRGLLDGICRGFSKNIPASLELLQDFPDEDVTVKVDAMRFTQVLMHLLDNAVKFTHSGYIKVGYHLSSDAHEVHIYVEDTGMGIPRNVHGLIFDRFYKHNEFSQGVGLGLPFCQLAMEKMQGRILLKSAEGKGTCFTVVLPIS